MNDKDKIIGSILDDVKNFIKLKLESLSFEESPLPLEQKIIILSSAFEILLIDLMMEADNTPNDPSRFFSILLAQIESLESYLLELKRLALSGEK